MSSDSRACHASPLTDGELHLLAERHPSLAGHGAAVVLGSHEKQTIELIEAFFDAFSESGDHRFGLTTLTAGERSLVSERRPEFEDHKLDMVAATSDAAIARLLDAAVALFGEGEVGMSKPAAKESKKEAPAKEKEPVAKESKDEKQEKTPAIAAMAPAAVERSNGSGGERAPWAARLES